MCFKHVQLIVCPLCFKQVVFKKPHAHISVLYLLIYLRYLGNLIISSSLKYFPSQAPLISSCRTTHTGSGHGSSCTDETRVRLVDFKHIYLSFYHHLERPQQSQKSRETSNQPENPDVSINTFVFPRCHDTRKGGWVRVLGGYLVFFILCK